MEEERTIETLLELKGLHCKISQSPDAKDLYSIRGYTDAIQIPKRLLISKNYVAIAHDIDLLAKTSH